jgi:hypothetical protein
MLHSARSNHDNHPIGDDGCGNFFVTSGLKALHTEGFAAETNDIFRSQRIYGGGSTFRKGRIPLFPKKIL